VSEATQILFVDDDPQLQRLVRVFLERMGYAVQTCKNATEALTVFQQDPERFAIVIADLILPDTKGEVMAKQMAAVNPRLKVLLCSGYPFALDSLSAGERARFGCLQKPFLPNMLTAAVDELLKRNIP
jgi:DNA-binding NtrC family response regulator